ncbi:Phosphatidylinositol 4-phosphate 5-kinase D3 (PIPK-D3/GPCR-PIPK) [Phytophthora palmivora]|uniref:Phosphatidylinositol 4-phosphate 5-kinase D3 (PIPK-D3/GPCR-PIPK) n=1 Tax=Phytophthora palmivora TaxID=4796 RepID=A0A2P4YNM5_9STRA|nr:Phosphatidylinositol 4-phosphate 5-kinase D3 (PIPK-D3/GPCR-PIPK) [Phytophthora palmivora]
MAFAGRGKIAVRGTRMVQPSKGSGILSRLISKILPFGIPPRFKKSLERWVRVRLQCRDAKGISCMKPIPYADRFRRNVIDTVIFGRRLGSKRRHPEKQQGESIMVDFTSMSMDVNFSMDIANLSMDTTSNLSMEI